jgi:protein-S-isoprenylcysteine O-methyltransferase Ste14
VRFVLPGVASAVHERSFGPSWWVWFGSGVSLLALLLLLALLRRRRRRAEPVVAAA